MTSSNGNTLRVTGHLCGEFTGPGEFPVQRPVTRSVWINGWINNREACDLRRYHAHYDVIVLCQPGIPTCCYLWQCWTNPLTYIRYMYHQSSFIFLLIIEFLCCPDFLKIFLFLVMGLGKVPNFINLKKEVHKRAYFLSKAVWWNDARCHILYMFHEQLASKFMLWQFSFKNIKKEIFQL